MDGNRMVKKMTADKNSMHFTIFTTLIAFGRDFAKKFFDHFHQAKQAGSLARSTLLLSPVF
jgi:hypothetical protein